MFAPRSVIMACSRFYSYIAIRPLLWLRTIRGSVREQFRLRGDLIGQMTSNSCHAPSIALFSFIVVCLHVLIAKDVRTLVRQSASPVIANQCRNTGVAIRLSCHCEPVPQHWCGNPSLLSLRTSAAALVWQSVSLSYDNRVEPK